MKQSAQATSDFQTSNGFAHQMTRDSQDVINQQAAISNPVIESLDPSVFEVTAKKHSLIWGS